MPFDVRRLETVYGMTWDDLMELEPRLEDLSCQVEACRPSENESDFDYENCWAKFKDPIANLVGWHRKTGDENLRTYQAYEIAYYTLWHALHD